MPLTRERTMAAKIAAGHPSTLKPGTTLAVSKIIPPLMTKEKRPKVKKLMGIVKNRKMGAIIALEMPRTKEAAMADPNPSTEILRKSLGNPSITKVQVISDLITISPLMMLISFYSLFVS